MEAAFAELPLALFTTLAPAGAGAFVALACAFFAASFTDEQLKKIDRMTLIPFVVVLVGFACSFAHLASPMNAVNTLNGFGSSPLTNEIVMGSVFVVVALAYLIVALTGKLKGAARKGFAAVVAVFAVVFACFTGFAYMMDTIASWNSPLLPLSIIGFCLGGGSAFAALVLALSGSMDGLGRQGKNLVLIVGGLGILLGAVAAGVQVGSVANLSNAVVSGADLVAEAIPVLVIGIVCLLATAAPLFIAVLGKGSAPLAGLAVVLALVGIFCLRLAFYATQLSVGLAC